MDAVFRLAEDPLRAAILLDIDGVLAPIVPRPEDARVPTVTQAELRRLSSRYALLACISGRASDDARRVVGVRGLVYVGNHGLELAPGAGKGTAARQLLGERGLERALYVGDDTTDLDAFRALDGLELGIRVAVASAESPPQLRNTADIVIETTADVLALLQQL